MDASSIRQAVQQRFGDANPELPNGFAEHTPMGVDALLALGLDPAAVLAWAAHHEPVAIDPGAPVAVRRAGIRAELERLPWDEALRRHVAQLAPHVDAHLFHGLIRTAHAVRSLRAESVACADLRRHLSPSRASASSRLAARSLVGAAV